MILGTFRNPATWSGKAGFYDGGSSRVLAMLAFHYVNEPEHELDVARAPPDGSQLAVERQPEPLQ